MTSNLRRWPIGSDCSTTRPTGSSPPDAHFTELMRLANDLFGLGAIDLAQWQALKTKAEQLHRRSPDANVAEEVADPDA